MYMYQDEPYCEEECYACTEKEQTIKDVKYWFQAVLDALYCSKAELDDLFCQYEEGDLEYYLEELAGYLNMKLPQKEIQVIRKNRTTELSGNSGKLEQPLSITYMLDSWKEANNSYLKSLTYTGA